MILYNSHASKLSCILFASQHDGLVIGNICIVDDAIKEPRLGGREIWRLQSGNHLT